MDALRWGRSKTRPVEEFLAELEELMTVRLQIDEEAEADAVSGLDEDAAVERAWEEEIGHRMDDLAAGRMKTRPVEELIAILEGLVR